MTSGVIVSKTGYCKAWGSKNNARRVAGLTKEEREAVRAGKTVLINGAPQINGTTKRRVIERNGRFYARMPEGKEVI